MALLHVMLAVPADSGEADRALTAVRRALPRRMAGGQAVLLLCDLPDAPHIRMPQDDALLRRLQSGIMSMERLRPQRVMLLVRRRTWDDASRLYVGSPRAMPARRVIAQLLKDGSTDAAFDAASVSPRSLAGRFDAVLIADVSLSCPPDVPARMLQRLRQSPAGCMYAPIVHAPRDAEPLIGRLQRRGFSLAPLLPAQDRLPLMATPEVLQSGIPADCPTAADCAFVSREMPAMRKLIADAHSSFARSKSPLPLLLPAGQLAALLLSAAWGHSTLACLALIAPELPALRRPSRLPGALVRLALLPALAAAGLETWLSRQLARSPRLRIALPATAKRPACCVLFGAVLLPLAVAGVHALVPLLPVSLLWLSAPLIVRALDTPVSERIPLTQDEQRLLRGEAEALFHMLVREEAANAGLRMLCDCAACLLGLLEPDEAARRVEARLPELEAQLAAPAGGALSRAAALTCAQLLRERMSQCDAALRPLPGQLEALVLAVPPPQEHTLLARLIRAALFESSAPLLAPGEADAPAEALFLPLSLLQYGKPEPASMPLTHPHTYLARRALPAAHPQALSDEKLLCLTAKEQEIRFLSLASAALLRPFETAFARSAVAAPAMPALACALEPAPISLPGRRTGFRKPRIRLRAAPQ